jgi:integrase
MEELKWPGYEKLLFPRPITHQDRTHDMWSSRTVIHKVVQAQKAAGIKVESRTHAMRHTHITLAAVQRAIAVDTEVELGTLHRQMIGHASERQSAVYIDKRALPAVRLATELEEALVGKSPGSAA